MNKSSLPNLILLPGLLSNSHVWRHQIAHLNDIANITVMSLTQRTPKDMINHVLANAPEKFALAGHSMGGRIAMELALIAPERVTKLCLLNTTCRLDTPEKHHSRMQHMERANNGMFETVIHELADLFVFQKDLYKEVINMFMTEGVNTFNNQEQAMLVRDDCCPLLPQISCQTLIIHADKDAVFSYEQNRELADLIPDSQFAVVSGSGHMSPMEKPEAITTLLRNWLIAD